MRGGTYNPYMLSSRSPRGLSSSIVVNGFAASHFTVSRFTKYGFAAADSAFDLFRTVYRASPAFSRTVSLADHAALSRIGDELLGVEADCIDSVRGDCSQFMLPRVAAIFEAARGALGPEVFRDLAAGVNADAARQSAAARAFLALQHAAGAAAVPGHVTEDDLPVLVAGWMKRNAADIAATLPEREEGARGQRSSGAAAGAAAAAAAVLAACTALAVVVRGRRAAATTDDDGEEPTMGYTAAAICTEATAAAVDV